MRAIATRTWSMSEPVHVSPASCNATSSVPTEQVTSRATSTPRAARYRARKRATASGVDCWAASLSVHHPSASSPGNFAAAIRRASTSSATARAFSPQALRNVAVSATTLRWLSSSSLACATAASASGEDWSHWSSSQLKDNRDLLQIGARTVLKRVLRQICRVHRELHPPRAARLGRPCQIWRGPRGLHPRGEDALRAAVHLGLHEVVLSHVRFIDRLIEHGVHREPRGEVHDLVDGAEGAQQLQLRPRRGHQADLPG